MSRVNWRLSHQSDDDTQDLQDSEVNVRKRSSRACDQCRKTKSKCERPMTGGACTNCAAANMECTFLGPSYKRGPPKGYINAIEHRWQGVESLLGAILSSNDPRARSLVADLQKDVLARDILDRVETGPFGTLGRSRQPANATKEDILVSFFSGESSAARDRTGPRRQSRVSREIVSSRADSESLPTPTPEWQDRLSRRLSSLAEPTTNFTFSSAIFPNTSRYSSSGEPPTRRRRLDSSADPDERRQGRGTSDRSSVDTDDGTEADHGYDAFGQMTMDENNEVHFNGKTRGLPLLSRNERNDDLPEGGIWMKGIWPPVSSHSVEYDDEVTVEIDLPPIELQERLLELYFRHVHIVFPVIDKHTFMNLYKARSHSGDFENIPELGREHGQTVSKLLLLVIFAISSRYLEDREAHGHGEEDMEEAGIGYLNSARDILNKVYHHSRMSTCQALLLFGIRDYGTGSFEAGWLHLGMAIRMARDLGLNRDEDQWQMHGDEFISDEERRLRKQIWWCCCNADRYSSVFMGRPPSIKYRDFDLKLPDVDKEEDNELWESMSTPNGKDYAPTPCRIWSCFRANSDLSMIIGRILQKFYAVRGKPQGVHPSKLQELEKDLDQWYIALPDCLRYDSASKRSPHPPNILSLHIQYHGARLLMYRIFLPSSLEEFERIAANPSNTVALKAFDLCQGAACQMSAIVATWHDYFDLQYCPPFLTHFIFVAANMHIVTLRMRPSNPQAAVGWEQCLNAVKTMGVPWPSARRTWDLLEGVRKDLERTMAPHIHLSDRRKRSAGEVLGEKSSDVLQREAFETETETSSPGPRDGRDPSKRIMAHMLGLDVPGVEPSTSYFPGYEWWPRSGGAPLSHDRQSSAAEARDGDSVSNGARSTGPEYFSFPSDTALA